MFDGVQAAEDFGSYGNDHVIYKPCRQETAYNPRAAFYEDALDIFLIQVG
jgi:hypothetical protein